MHHAHLYSDESFLPPEYLTPGINNTIIKTETLGIAEVRNLIDLVSQKSVGKDSSRQVVVCVKQIRHEAQNALLKVLEEPPERTIFHLVVYLPATLLPTLKSRLVAVEGETSADSAIAKEFLQLGYGERLALVGEKTKAKDIGWWLELVNGLEELISGGDLAKTQGKVILNTKKHLQAPGSSAKLLLEHLALSLPAT